MIRKARYTVDVDYLERRVKPIEVVLTRGGEEIVTVSGKELAPLLENVTKYIVREEKKEGY